MEEVDTEKAENSDGSADLYGDDWPGMVWGEEPRLVSAAGGTSKSSKSECSTKQLWHQITT